MITNDLNMLSMPRGRGIGDYGVQDPINAWPGAGPFVIIYMNRIETGGISQTGYTQGDEINRFQRFRSLDGVWTPWEPVTSAVPPDIYVELAGDSMTGPLILSGAPTQDAGAATKLYVDDAIASQPPNAPPPLYQGTWQVAANIPDLTLVAVENGFTWRAVTADPAVPERAPAGIPGIGGQMVSQGDAVVWNAANNVYDLIPNLSMTQPEGDLRYVNVTGDTMTGPLILAPGAPGTDDAAAASKLYVDIAVAGGGLFQGLWQVAPNIPDLIAAAATALNGYTWRAVTANPAVGEVAAAGIPGIGGMTVNNGDAVIWNDTTSVYDLLRGGGLTIAEADLRYLQLAGGVMAGTVSFDDVHFITGLPTPVNNSHAANKAYADTKLAVVQVAGTPALSTITLRGQYYPQTPYIPADAPAGAANSWAMEVAAGAAANIWQLFQSGPDAWSRNSTNGGAAWTPWVALGAGGTGGAFLPLVGGTMLGGIDMDGNGIINLPAPLNGTAAVNQDYADTKLALAGGTMTGPLVLAAGAPGTDAAAAASKAYVDTAIANAGLYQGTWQVATNVPDLITAAPLNGYTWIAETVDPMVPETAPAGIPGIGGDLISNNDLVIWNTALAIYEHVAAGGMTQPEADARYLQLAGGVMTGPINMSGRPITGLSTPTQPGDAANKFYIDNAALLLTGGTLTGPLVLEAGAPQADDQAVPKSYVDAALAPFTWQPVAAIVMSGSSGGPLGNYNYRQRINTVAFVNSGGGKVRVTLRGAQFQVEAYIGYAAATGDPYDFEAAPVQMLFGGGTTGQFPGNSAATMGDIQAEADFVVDPAKPLLISMLVIGANGFIPNAAATANHRAYWAAGGNPTTVNPPAGSYTDQNNSYIVTLVEQGDNAAAYLPISGGTMAGAIDMGGNKLVNVPLPLDNGDAASKVYVDQKGVGLPIITATNGTSPNTFTANGLYLADYYSFDFPPNNTGGCVWVSRTGARIWQHLDTYVSGAPAYYRRYSANGGAAWSGWSVDVNLAQADATYLALAGGTMDGPVDLALNQVLNAPLPQDSAEAANKSYVDTAALPVFVAAAGTSYNAMTARGTYYPATPYAPANGPTQPGNGHWICEVRRSANIAWQYLDTDVGGRWFRWCLDVNVPTQWGSWSTAFVAADLSVQMRGLAAMVDDLTAKLAALERA